MTNQEIFTKVKNHLLAQGKKAEELSSMGLNLCKYRGPDETKCAIGCLIPDELYDPAMEGAWMEGVHLEGGEWVSCSNGCNRVFARVLNDAGIPATSSAWQLLRALQSCHDGSLPEVWEQRLTEIAQDFNLNNEVQP